MIENNNKTPMATKVSTKCNKCKKVLDHDVISQDLDGIIGKVKCLTCGSEHKFIAEKKKAVRAVKPKKVDPAKDFNLLTEATKGKRPQNYSMSGSFRVGDVIDHNTFGMGIVISALNKQMEVVFSDRPRILVYNREGM
jgi:hypothetical protein